MKLKAVCAVVRIAMLCALFALMGCAGVEDRDAGGASGRRADVVLAGLSQIGSPYVYGGTNPRGFDCSGLTYYAHHSVGLAIPRTASAQRKASKPIRSRRPRAGDMVFFRTGPGVHHVGLMVDDERFVHASTSKHQVRLDRLYTPYWQAHYLGAGTYLY